MVSLTIGWSGARPVLALVVAGLLAACPSARALTPVTGHDMCPGCTAVVDHAVAESQLLAFKLATVRNDDVLFDERAAGGPATCGAELSDVGWQIPPNWRIPVGPSNSVIVLVTTRSFVHLDIGSIHATNGQLGETSLPQVVGALSGRLSPDVAAKPAGLVVRWTPLREADDTRSPEGCAPAGELGGFLIGYDIYRLDAAAHPAPTLMDFATSGYLGYADLSALDFTVADASGQGGSDRDPTDALTLRNPDGQPDTGDEVLAWTDSTTSPLGTYWYRVQPVLQGDMSALASSTVCDMPPDATMIDLDGDGLDDALDLFSDGLLEFIDPSHHGLGLTHAGEILSSPLPGRASAVRGHVECDASFVVDGEINCHDGLDDDTDGLGDCADPDCCADATCATPPRHVADLRVARVGGGAHEQVRLTWADSPGIAPVVHDVVSGWVTHLRTAGGLGDATCLANDVAGTQLDDAQPFEHDAPWPPPDPPPVPPPPSRLAVFYLVRAESSCGSVAAYGFDSLGQPELPGADCAP